MTQFPSQDNRAYGLNYGSPYTTPVTTARFFNTVYAWMCVGLAVTAVVGMLVAKSAWSMYLYANPMSFLVMGLGLFALGWYTQSQIGRLSFGVATTLFMVYATIMGVMLSGIFLVYPVSTLASAFLLTAGTFGAMSLYGFITKRDLTGIGGIACMLVIGLFIASIVNFFLASNALSWIITYAVLILFVVITAYETQMLKNWAAQLAHDPDMANRVAIGGALMLYVAFINIFISILRILGDRR
jgi:uncharacterized protein